MSHRFVISPLAGLAFLFAAATANAEKEEPESWIPGDLSGNVGIVSDYSFRGLSQTQRDPALQGGLDWAHDSGVFLGTWGSTIRLPDDASYLEQDFYGGYASTLGALSWDVRAAYYFYPKVSYDYWEFVLNGAYAFETFSLFGTFLGTPDFFGSLGVTTYVSGGVDVPIPLGAPWVQPSLKGSAGWTRSEEDVDDDDTYLDWNAGLTFALPIGLSLDFRYVDTNAKGYEGNADARFVFGALYAF